VYVPEHLNFTRPKKPIFWQNIRVEASSQFQRFENGSLLLALLPLSLFAHDGVSILRPPIVLVSSVRPPLLSALSQPPALCSASTVHSIQSRTGNISYQRYISNLKQDQQDSKLHKERSNQTSHSTTHSTQTLHTLSQCICNSCAYACSHACAYVQAKAETGALSQLSQLSRVWALPLRCLIYLLPRISLSLSLSLSLCPLYLIPMQRQIQQI
jgi:hypothetical protein